MSGYSASDVIDRYESDIAAWECQLQQLEEQAKGLSLEDTTDRDELYQLAQDTLPDVSNLYDQVQQSRQDAKHLEDKIDDVLENPRMRYTAIPESLNKQERMKERINELDETYHITEERQEYISHTLEDEIGVSLDDHSSTMIQRYLDSAVETIREDPDTAFTAGMIVGGIGFAAADYILDRLDGGDQ